MLIIVVTVWCGRLELEAGLELGVGCWVTRSRLAGLAGSRLAGCTWS